MSNPYYAVTGAPVTQSRGYSYTIRSEYSLVETGFDAVYTAMLLRGLKGGETWTGTHVFTGATVTFATQSASDNSTKAATTAYADSAVSASAVTLNASIALKADIASPTLTGTPAAPTAAPGTNTTQIATTAFVADAAATKADIASPTLTGTPTAPTAAPGTNTTQIATTAFVADAAATKADIASPALTGTPTAPTASAGTSTTQLATCAFVMGTSFSAALPSQAGNSGKFVTTDGSTASWEHLPAGATIYTALNFGGF